MAVISRSGGVVASTETGPSWLTRDFLASGAVVWVDSVTGSDSNAGTNRKLPKATIFGASGAISVVTASNGQVMVCEKTHREAPSAAYTWSKAGLTLASLGSGTDRTQITSGVAGALITITGNFARIENIYFPAATAATTDVILMSSGDRAEIRDCYFQLGANNTDAVETSNATGLLTVRGGTFIMTGSGTSQIGVHASGGAFIDIEDTTFDGGSLGFTDAALSVAHANADNFRCRSVVLQNYSEAKVTSGAKGYAAYTVDGTSRWTWVE